MKKITKILTISAATLGAAIMPITILNSCNHEPTVQYSYTLDLISEQAHLVDLNDTSKPISLSFTLARKDGDLTDEILSCDVIKTSASSLDVFASVTRKNGDVTVNLMLQKSAPFQLLDQVKFDLSFDIKASTSKPTKGIVFNNFSIMIIDSTTTVLPVSLLNINKSVMSGLKPGLDWNKILTAMPNINKIEIPADVLEIQAWSLTNLPQNIKTVEILQGESNVIPLWIDENGLANMSHVETLILPERLEYVEKSGFEGCTSIKTLDISSWSKEKFDGANPFYGYSIFKNWPDKGTILFGEHCGLGAYYFLKDNGFAAGEPVGMPDGWFDYSVGTDEVKDGFKYTHITDQTVTGKEEKIIYAVADSSVTIKNNKLTVPSWATGLAPKALSANNQGDVDISSMKELDMSQNSSITKIPFGCCFGDKLETIKLNPATTCIDSSAFRANENITSINWTELTNLKWIGGCAFYANYSRPSLGNVDLSNSQLVSIGPSAFYNTSIESIKLPSTLNKVGACAFSAASFSANTQITIPNSVTYIGFECFRSCHNIVGVTLNEESKLGYVGEGAFASMFDIGDGLVFYFPKNVFFIGDGVFTNTKIIKLVVSPNNTNYGDANNCLFAKDINNHFTKLLAVSSNVNMDTFDDDVIKFVTEIGQYAFGWANVADNTGTSNIDVDFSRWESLQNIGANAFTYFNYAYDAYTITLPKTIRSIGSNAFENSGKLVEVNWTDAEQTVLESMGSNVFAGCTNLSSIVIPNKIASFSANIFGNNVNLKSITLPNTVKEISGKIQCYQLEEIDVSSFMTVPTSAWGSNSLFHGQHKDGVVYIRAGTDASAWKTFFISMGLKDTWTFQPL